MPNCRLCGRIVRKGDDVYQVEKNGSAVESKFVGTRKPPAGLTYVAVECYPTCAAPTGARQAAPANTATKKPT
jgi:hypothetical protein